jgi:hypothetical protein
MKDLIRAIHEVAITLRQEKKYQEHLRKAVSKDPDYAFLFSLIQDCHAKDYSVTITFKDGTVLKANPTIPTRSDIVPQTIEGRYK